MKVRLDLPDDGNWPLPPGKPDGGLWPWMLVSKMQDREGITYADTVTELVGELIDGYDDLARDSSGNDQALEARYSQALTMAAGLQAMVCRRAVDAGDLDVDAEPDETLTAFFQERTVPFVGLDGDTFWNHPVPLVLLDVDYAPFTDRDRPSGNILWIEPSDEAAYLRSLDRLGLVVFRVADAAKVSQVREDIGQPIDM